MSRRLPTSIAVLGLLALTTVARSGAAGEFDASGKFAFDSAAVATQSFEASSDSDGGVVEAGAGGAGDAAVSEPHGIHCEDSCSYQLLAAGDELALDGQSYLRVDTDRDSFEVDVPLPSSDGSYQFRVWVRHARATVRSVFEYDGTEREAEAAYMFPSGLVTSDGWVELISNPVSVTGSSLSRAFIRIDAVGMDVDAAEVVPAGNYDAGSACFGAGDPICGAGAICVAERCREGNNYVPPLPAGEYRESVANYLMSRLSQLFGGHFTRTQRLPQALLVMERMKTANTPWEFWNAFGEGIRRLSDWHTGTGLAIPSGSSRRLGVCFIEGQADLSRTMYPSTPGHADVLVSHVGPDNTLGLKPGDRLVMVDGQHPADWARSLAGVNWGYHAADDPDVDADLVEAMRSLIPGFARSFSVIRCDATGKTCGPIETLSVRDIPSGGSIPSCDNRPAYHLENPPESQPGRITVFHRLPFTPWRDKVVDSAPGENIYGMTWDNLYGTSQGLTPFFKQSNDFFKQNARGVILDHRAGNGGTIDAPEAITELVRKPAEISVGPGFMTYAAYDGPFTTEEGLALYDEFSKFKNLVYHVGSVDADLDLPVALLIHRDGSASDWLPHGMKGAPKVRIFGPHETAGAFSSFYQFAYWSNLSWQMASGDTITKDGEALIGHGIEPDEVVEHTQSALLDGRDLVYEAALSWVRQNLKGAP